MQEDRLGGDACVVRHGRGDHLHACPGRGGNPVCQSNAFSAFAHPVTGCGAVECLTQKDHQPGACDNANGILSIAAWSVYRWEERR